MNSTVRSSVLFLEEFFLTFASFSNNGKKYFLLLIENLKIDKFPLLYDNDGIYKVTNLWSHDPKSGRHI